MLNPKPNDQNNVRFRSYNFSLEIIKLVKNFPSTKIYLIFTDQLLRSATSIGANLVEARSSNSKIDFSRYYRIALKSANETEYWRDSDLINEKNLLFGLISEVQEICKMIGSSLITLKNGK